MTDITATIDTHLAGYAEPDRARRDELLSSVWSADGALLDPPFDGTGHQGIADMVDVLLTHYPEHRFERTTEVDAHHDFARYGWALVTPTGEPAVTGYDFAQLGPDGKLVRVVGFFGDLPEQA
jgi:hypothetical protein